MDKRTFDSRIAKMEGKKRQARIGEVREITADIALMAAGEALESADSSVENTEVIGLLIAMGNKKLAALKKRAKLP